MTDPNTQSPPPPPTVQLPSLVPSASTNATVLGGAIATLIIYYLGTRGMTLPAGAESAIAVIVAALAGYIPKSGRADP